MKLELLHVVNGYRKFHIGFYDNIQDAVKALKKEVDINSAINKPKYRKSLRGNTIRIDYGAKTCYYLIQPREVKK